MRTTVNYLTRSGQRPASEFESSNWCRSVEDPKGPFAFQLAFEPKNVQKPAEPKKVFQVSPLPLRVFQHCSFKIKSVGLNHVWRLRAILVFATVGVGDHWLWWFSFDSCHRRRSRCRCCRRGCCCCCCRFCGFIIFYYIILYASEIFVTNWLVAAAPAPTGWGDCFVLVVWCWYVLTLHCIVGFLVFLPALPHPCLRTGH